LPAGQPQQFGSVFSGRAATAFCPVPFSIGHQKLLYKNFSMWMLTAIQGLSFFNLYVVLR